MSDILVCPTTKTECQNLAVCSIANAPLKGAIVRVRKETGGHSWRLAKAALTREIIVQTNLLGIVCDPVEDGDEGDIVICPREAASGDLGQKLGPEIAAIGVGAVAAKSVDHVIADIKAHKKS